MRVPRSRHSFCLIEAVTYDCDILLTPACCSPPTLVTHNLSLFLSYSEGLVLIEDLRAGGIFAAQPKSDFSTREGKNQQAPRTPDVIMAGSGISDPTEDFRTNVSLNLEGL